MKPKRSLRPVTDLPRGSEFLFTDLDNKEPIGLILNIHNEKSGCDAFTTASANLLYTFLPITVKSVTN